MMIQTVLSDAGNVLFDDTFYVNTQIASLRIVLKNRGRELTFDEVYSSFCPYKNKAQTIISEEEAINQFLYNNGCSAKFGDYEVIKNSMEPRNRKRLLFEGVTETLELVRNIHVDFYILTNAMKPGTEFQEDLDRMLITQLRERGVYDSETFCSSNYVTAMISSKDLGIIKPAEDFFDTVLALRRNVRLKSNEAVFVAHASDEIFGAANLGIPVIAFNYQGEKNVQDILTRIDRHNQRYRDGQATSGIYTIEKFIEIPEIVAKLNSS